MNGAKHAHRPRPPLPVDALGTSSGRAACPTRSTPSNNSPSCSSSSGSTSASRTPGRPPAAGQKSHRSSPIRPSAWSPLDTAPRRQGACPRQGEGLPVHQDPRRRGGSFAAQMENRRVQDQQAQPADRGLQGHRRHAGVEPAHRPGRRHQGPSTSSGVTVRVAPPRRRERGGSERDAERRRLLDHHHGARQPLVRKGRKTEQPVRLVGVDVVVRLEAEQERVGQHLPDPEQHAGEPEPLVQRSAARAVPDRSAASRRARRRTTNDRCSRRCTAGCRSAASYIAGRCQTTMTDDPERHGDPRGRSRNESARRTEPRPRERHEEVAREEEHRERPPYREQREHDPEVGDQHVLEHVGRLEVLLGDRVERRDEAHDDDGDAGEKQRKARRGRQLRASSPQPPPAGDEERDGHGREHEHERVEDDQPARDPRCAVVPSVVTASR